MTILNDFARKLLDTPEVATVGTIMPNGEPQLSVVWVTRDGDDILFSTTAARRKARNVVADERVSVLMFPQDDPYHYVEIRGIATVTEDPDGSLIHELSRKYTGKDWSLAIGDDRVIVRVTPEKLISH